MESIFKSIDDTCDFNVIRYSQNNEREDYFYLLEQSAIQILREFPSETPIEVTELYSERRFIEKNIESIKAAKSVSEFLQFVLPLIQNGSFECSDLTIILDKSIRLSSHDDGEVHLISGDILAVRNLLRKVLIRQNYDDLILNTVLEKPDLYHILERPNNIVSSLPTFDEVIEAL